jgi:NTP pyrophosphatase (non-canonical NTP hydrolase)
MTHSKHAVTEPTREVPMEAIELFVTKHNCMPTQQVLALVEEVGELSEALNSGLSDDQLAEELADVVFVALTLGVIYDVDVASELHRVTQENLQKNTATEGSKVTKE